MKSKGQRQLQSACNVRRTTSNMKDPLAIVFQAAVNDPPECTVTQRSIVTISFNVTLAQSSDSNVCAAAKSWKPFLPRRKNEPPRGDEKSREEDHLVFVATACATTASALKLASLRLAVGLRATLGNTGRRAKVSVCLARCARTLEQDGVLALGCLQRQLVKGHQFSPGLQDATPRTVGHLQRTYPQFGDLKDALVVSNGSHDDSDLVLATGQFHVACKSSDGHWWSVVLAHEEPLEDNAVELGIGAPRKEAI